MSRRKHETIVLRVTLAVPVGATSQHATDYTREAVKNGKHDLDPAQPMFNLDVESVRVQMIERHTQYVDTSNPAPTHSRGRVSR